MCNHNRNRYQRNPIYLMKSFHNPIFIRTVRSTTMTPEKKNMFRFFFLVNHFFLWYWFSNSIILDILAADLVGRWFRSIFNVLLLYMWFLWNSFAVTFFAFSSFSFQLQLINSSKWFDKNVRCDFFFLICTSFVCRLNVWIYVSFLCFLALWFSFHDSYLNELMNI